MDGGTHGIAPNSSVKVSSPKLQSRSTVPPTRYDSVAVVKQRRIEHHPA